MTDLAALAATHLFPIRHHSPRSSAVLRAFLDREDPAVVLVEGPEDAGPLLEALTDERTEPPVAILGYRTDGPEDSCLWPMSSYSPEYVAFRWARAHGKEAAFIDLPVGRTLAARGADGPGDDEDEDDAEAPRSSRAGATEDRLRDARGLGEACAEARGFRSFQEFWEASFEAPAYGPDAFKEALSAYAELVTSAYQGPLHRARDAFMARRILERLDAGAEPGSIAVVAGAAHAVAFARGRVELGLDERLPPAVPSACTLIPYSYPRLAEQLGYGAGNRAPRYYQRAHDAGCSFRRATLEVLVDFAGHLRLRGFSASLSDTLEAYRLAVALAGLRGKADPGLDEVREATVAAMCHGDATHVDGFLWPSVVGRSVGRVSARIGRTPLQEEFWREVRDRKLPAEDSVTTFVLKLHNEVEVGTSVLLHRLRVAGVPYASYLGDRVGAAHVGAGARRGTEAAGGYAALRRVSEAWEARWTPATDAALVEKVVLGASLGQVAARALGEQLAAARTTGEAADVLLEAVVTSSPAAAAAALAACDRLAATDEDLPSLARACRALSGLVSYGSSRALPALAGDAIPGASPLLSLCQETFARAVLRVLDACTGVDEAVGPAKEALRTLHDVALAQPLVDRGAWFEAAREVAQSFAVNPSAAGLCAGLLYLAQGLDDATAMRLLGLRLSDTAAPERAAGFLGGFLEVNALVLVRSRPVVAALDAFLTGIERGRFADALPVVRRAFASLGPTERRYLLEHVLALRAPGSLSRAGEAVLLEKDKAKLRQMNDELAKAMDDLDDLL